MGGDTLRDVVELSSNGDGATPEHETEPNGVGKAPVGFAEIISYASDW